MSGRALAAVAFHTLASFVVGYLVVDRVLVTLWVGVLLAGALPTWIGCGSRLRRGAVRGYSQNARSMGITPGGGHAKREAHAWRTKTTRPECCSKTFRPPR